jgi:orotate phosphoribosyltransferase
MRGGAKVAYDLDKMRELYDAKKEKLMRSLWENKRVEIRDVDAGETAFLYSTKNHGPGYVDIKGGVGIRSLFEDMLDLLADRIILDGLTDIELIVGMMTGGAMPGFRLAYLLSERLERTIHYIYQRGARKEGGHAELDTGDRNNPLIKPGCKTLVVEELVNFAGTTTNGVLYERNEKKRIVEDAACILYYENPVAISKLEANSIRLHAVVGLPGLLNFGLREKYATEKAVASYFEFLRDPRHWNESRNFTFYGG